MLFKTLTLFVHTRSKRIPCVEAWEEHLTWRRYQKGPGVHEQRIYHSQDDQQERRGWFLSLAPHHPNTQGIAHRTQSNQYKFNPGIHDQVIFAAINSSTIPRCWSHYSRREIFCCVGQTKYRLIFHPNETRSLVSELMTSTPRFSSQGSRSSSQAAEYDGKRSGFGLELQLQTNQNQTGDSMNILAFLQRDKFERTRAGGLFLPNNKQNPYWKEPAEMFYLHKSWQNKRWNSATPQKQRFYWTRNSRNEGTRKTQFAFITFSFWG